MCGAHKTNGWSQPLFALSHVVKLVFLSESYLLVRMSVGELILLIGNNHKPVGTAIMIKVVKICLSIVEMRKHAN